MSPTRIVPLTLLALALSCGYAPDLTAGKLQCAASDGSCPDGTQCGGDNLCHPPGQLPPGAPQSVTATGAAGTIAVGWQPGLPGSSTTSSYTVIGLSSNGGGQLTSIVSGGTLAASFTGLTKGLTYSFTVTATNAFGVGLASAASAAATVQ